MIQGHGDDSYIYSRTTDVNFSSNVCPIIDHKGLEDNIAQSISLINSYPEPDGGSLATILSRKSGINENEIVVTNGATEAIYLIANAFKNKNSVILSPTFSEYSDACLLFSHNVRCIESLDEVEEDDEIIWLCNPNNPTGSVVEKSILERFINKHLNKILILDLSYESFTRLEILSSKEVCSYSNIIAIYSLTKRYKIPGLRVGYLVANISLTNKVKEYRMPWSVNILAIEAGKYLTELKESLFNLDKLLEETLRFRLELNKIKGITAFPTNTHFFLCKTDFGTADELKSYLIEKHGLLIRDASNFFGLDKSYFRIATQLKEENDKLIKALKYWKEQYI
ncbi:MAG: aminotransferase class I/II-fold pyridoxal phosphate-dependent enzyme [Bacteroidales bacterium]|nr:aminotransferase class I/II-fold pyridoxal phosphate-dependent enzyme [Bacteroidales bacterium]